MCYQQPMASLSKPVGYECEFADQVPEDYLCKLCNHVAREPNITSCCGECFCKACIKTYNKGTCPLCRKDAINIAEQQNYQDKILGMKVHCLMKDHGCKWIGQLQHLDAHSDDCVYDQIKCDQCNEDVKKRNMDTHLVEECPEREYMCKYCNFKATYRIVSKQHLEVCTYFILSCPNRCGATFERGELEDHMKMCPLQKVQCEFSYAGCQAEFIRNEQKEHMEQNTQKHLALMAAATLKIQREQQNILDLTRQKQQQKFQDQEQVSSDQNVQQQQHTFESNLQHHFEVFENKLEELTEQVQRNMQEQERHLREQHEQFDELRREQNRQENGNRTGTLLKTVSLLASVLLAVLLGIHFQSESAVERAESPRGGSEHITHGINDGPDSTLWVKFEELQLEITNLKNWVREQKQPATEDKLQQSEQADELQTQIVDLQRSVRESIYILTQNTTEQYSHVKQDYLSVRDEAEATRQDTDKRFSEIDAKQQDHDRKLKEVNLCSDRLNQVRDRVANLEQKITELSAKVTSLDLRLGDLKQEIDDRPPPPPPPHPHPPHPHPHPHRPMRGGRGGRHRHCRHH